MPDGRVQLKGEVGKFSLNIGNVEIKISPQTAKKIFLLDPIATNILIEEGNLPKELFSEKEIDKLRKIFA
ncbi:hypothetical protein KAU09_01225 [Candidatus Parcubacteria bacterium]|nr:hypothetical protein [Candidatus Parcubacteria bacterium]